MKTCIFLGFLLGALSIASIAMAATSGVYGQVLLAVAPNGGLQGRFLNSSGEGVTETCEIFFAGAAETDAAVPVTTWDFINTTDTGSLDIRPDAIVFTDKNYRKFAGCGMAGYPELGTGETFGLVRRTAWTSLDQIGVTKAFLHAAPTKSGRSHAYLIKGDVVGLLGEKPGWLQVEYVPPADTTKSVLGWIKANEASPLAPP